MKTIHPAPRGFTLIELLTVIAIIGILAAIIIPTVGRVRESARAAQSISNLRQCAMAIRLYAEANRDRLPGGYSFPAPGQSPAVWQDQVAPFVGMREGSSQRVSPQFVLNSPYQVITDPNRADWWNEGTTFGISLYMKEPQWNFRLGAVQSPSRTVLVGDKRQGANDYVRPSVGAYGGGGQAQRPEFRHGGQRIAHFAHVDGSVRGYTSEELAEDPADGRPNLWRWW